MLFKFASKVLQVIPVVVQVTATENSVSEQLKQRFRDDVTNIIKALERFDFFIERADDINAYIDGHSESIVKLASSNPKFTLKLTGIQDEVGIVDHFLKETMNSRVISTKLGIFQASDEECRKILLMMTKLYYSEKIIMALVNGRIIPGIGEEIAPSLDAIYVDVERALEESIEDGEMNLSKVKECIRSAKSYVILFGDDPTDGIESKVVTDVLSATTNSLSQAETALDKLLNNFKISVENYTIINSFNKLLVSVIMCMKSYINGIRRLQTGQENLRATRLTALAYFNMAVKDWTRMTAHLIYLSFCGDTDKIKQFTAKFEI